MAAVGFAALCECSMLFDLRGLGSNGTADAAADDGPNADDRDTAADGLDEAPVDAQAESTGDETGVDAAQDDSNATDTAVDADAGPDAVPDSQVESSREDVGGSDAPADSPADTQGAPDATDSGGISSGLVALYAFDESTGAISADGSGHGLTATMQGATFAAGQKGNAAAMNGNGQYVILPSGIVAGLTSFSISVWVYPNAVVMHARVFDFGTGTNGYMFLTPRGSMTRFAIFTSANGGEQRLDTGALAIGRWQHVAVTLNGTTGTSYVDGMQVAQNTAMTLNPASLGITTQNWLGRSQFASDPYLNGMIDELRIYDHALTASEVQQLYQQHL